MARFVLWVTWPVWNTAPTSLSRGSGGKAIPTGATRIAAPLVAPCRPVSSVEAPAEASAKAWRVDGPRKYRRPRRLHPALPGQQGLGETGRIDAAFAVAQHPAENDGLIRVVGHPPRRHAAADRVVVRTRLEAVQHAVARRDPCGGLALRRHTEGIADRKPEQSPMGAVP